MCARFGVTTTAAAFARLLGMPTPAAFAHGVNIPPGQSISALLCPPRQGQAGDVPLARGADDPWAFERLYWGFIPSWDARGRGRGVTNARLDKRGGRYWRKAFAARRCVVPADWWYEWRGEKGARQPHAIRPASGEPFFLAGVWSQPRSLESGHRAASQRCCAIITRAANPQLAAVHHRMPVALTSEGVKAWLRAPGDSRALAATLDRHSHRDFAYWPVSTRVNRPSPGDDETLLTRVADGT